MRGINGIRDISFLHHKIPTKKGGALKFNKYSLCCFPSHHNSYLDLKRKHFFSKNSISYDHTMSDSARKAAVSKLHAYLSRGFCNTCSNSLYARLQDLDVSETQDGIQIRLPQDQEISLNVQPNIPRKDFPVSNHTSYGLNMSRQSLRSSDYNDSNGNRGHDRDKKAPTRWSELSTQTPSYGSAVMKGLGSNSASFINSTHSEKPNWKPIAVGKSGQETDFDNLDEEMRHSSRSELQSREHSEWTRFALVKRKKDFVLMERIRGRTVNVLQGLELHSGVFTDKEQEKIVNCIYSFQKSGREGRLRERTYSEPKKWLRGKGRVTIQFGCCYNYATDKNGNPPGIIRAEEVDPLPPMFKMMIKRMVRWHVLPPSCIPDSCIVNIYEEGDCIPPHIDHHDFLRPFCTVSFLAECNILFGSNLQIVGPGEFSGPFSIPLPVGSVFILSGNGADVAKHCVPGVPAKRISITFRKMDNRKLPYEFKPDPELQGVRPLQQSDRPQQPHLQPTKVEEEEGRHNISNDLNDFPPLSFNGHSSNKQKISASKRCIRQ